MRSVYKILKDFIRTGSVIVFVDDILVATETIEEHLQIIKRLFETLSDNYVKLQLSKCQFLKTKIEYLGYDIAYNQITPSERHIQAVQEYPVPHDKKSLHRFIGLMSY